MRSYKENLPNITTLIFDVDGVLTNGDVILFQDEVVRTLNSRDAFAIQYAIKMGMRVLIITGGNSEAVKKRLLNLGATEVCLKSSNKLSVYEDLKAKYNFEDSEVMYMGDDLPDHAVMQKVGVSACPQDAAVEIKAIADYQSPFNGGRHAVRDIIEQTLRVQDKWFKEDVVHW
ncbi:KdsC family phosphatase [Lishizhenia sp.]|uniref:KdsC family phosphatase n=1 Tax=Lishizhenia sp. TaxID=2497594 RepID=UPI00299D2A57|nr:HAD hydrolase family protein [Lishizhenia sp.]MDX1446341.1 HAD hydrolase family protein [Lishizhenia sp.]